MGSLMAATTTAFEAEIIAAGFGNPDRGLQAGAAYKLRQAYLMGMVDPAAHTKSKSNAKHVASLTGKATLASFDAIAAI
jgi:hypothetical protein